MPEDRRQASSLVVGLSGTVTTVTLGLIAGSIGLGSFLIDKYEVGTLFWISAGIALAFLGASAYQGGSGVWAIVAKGADGDWLTKTPSNSFGRQTASAIVGAALLLSALSLGLSADRRDAPEGPSVQQVQATERATVVLRDDLKRLTIKLDEERDARMRLTHTLRVMARQIRAHIASRHAG